MLWRSLHKRKAVTRQLYFQRAVVSRTGITFIRASLARESTRAISKSGLDAALLNVDRLGRRCVEFRAS
jgi:hypothetical protein